MWALISQLRRRGSEEDSTLIIFIFAPCINSIKTLFIILTDAHNYKITGMLKTIKIPTIAPTCFGSRRNHHQGAISCLAKTTIMTLLYSSLMTSMSRRRTSLLCKRAVHGRGRNCSAFLYRVPQACTTGRYALIGCISWNNKKVFWELWLLYTIDDRRSQIDSRQRQILLATIFVSNQPSTQKILVLFPICEPGLGNAEHTWD
jgi:hypothetical protein